jgi:hypothetical protein
VTTTLDTAGTQGRRRAKLLALLAFIFCLIFFEPLLGAGVTKLFPRRPTRLGIAEISIPKTWMTLERSVRVDAWKPCKTILCSAASRPEFVVEVSKLPVGSDQIWRNAAIKVVRSHSSGHIVSATIPGGSGIWECLEGDPALGDGKIVTACSNFDLRLNSSFFGDASFRQTFYSVLVSAHKI